MSHQIMSLMGAAIGTYHPELGAGTSTYYGCNNTGADLFGAGTTAIIRSMLISNTTGAAVTVQLFRTGGDRVDEWITGAAFAQSLLCGPDGFILADGFYVTVSVNSGAYVTIIYDAV